MEQINEHSPLWVEWEQRKVGRKITHLSFRFGEKIQKYRCNLQKEKIKTMQKSSSGALYGIPLAHIEKKAQPAESYEDTALRLLDEARKKRS